MKPSRIEDLIVGARYFIRHDGEWTGTAIYIKPEYDGYAVPVGLFMCDDGITGAFGIEEIEELIETPKDKDLAFWVRNLLNQLPEDHSWLDTETEKHLRELSK